MILTWNNLTFEYTTFTLKKLWKRIFKAVYSIFNIIMVLKSYIKNLQL